MITVRSTWCNSVSNVSRQSMPRDITGTIVDCISSTSISLAATLCRGHVSTTALLLTALETNFCDARDELVQVCRPRGIRVASKPFGVAIDALLPSTRHTTETLSFSIRSAKCNAIRHAKDNFSSPLSFDDDAAIHGRAFLAIRIFSGIIAT